MEMSKTLPRRQCIQWHDFVVQLQKYIFAFDIRRKHNWICDFHLYCLVGLHKHTLTYTVDTGMIEVI